MSGASIQNRPFPFPGLELSKTCKNVDGATITAKTTVVRLVTGKNTTGATLDGVPNGEYFTDHVVSLTKSAYPGSTDGGPASTTSVPHFIGIPLETAVDDGYAHVVFRGLVKGVVLGLAAAAAAGRGTRVLLDASDSYKIKLAGSAGVTPANGDILIGTLATSVSSGATTADVMWDGVFPEVESIGAS